MMEQASNHPVFPLVRIDGEKVHFVEAVRQLRQYRRQPTGNRELATLVLTSPPPREGGRRKAPVLMSEARNRHDQREDGEPAACQVAGGLVCCFRGQSWQASVAHREGPWLVFGSCVGPLRAGVLANIGVRGTWAPPNPASRAWLCSIAAASLRSISKGVGRVWPHVIHLGAKSRYSRGLPGLCPLQATPLPHPDFLFHA